MSADLHIHAFAEGLTEDDLRDFFSHTLGSKYFDPRKPNHTFESMHRVDMAPNVWIGEVSWLVAALTGDDSDVPSPVRAIHELIGEDLPVLTDELETQILEALALPNRTGYTVNTRDKVEPWLTSMLGARLFTVSW